MRVSVKGVAKRTVKVVIIITPTFANTHVPWHCYYITKISFPSNSANSSWPNNAYNSNSLYKIPRADFTDHT